MQKSIFLSLIKIIISPPAKCKLNINAFYMKRILDEPFTGLFYTLNELIEFLIDADNLNLKSMFHYFEIEWNFDFQLKLMQFKSVNDFKMV